MLQQVCFLEIRLFLIPPPILPLLPSQFICVLCLREKDHFLLILGQSEGLTEEGSPTPREHESKTRQ